MDFTIRLYDSTQKIREKKEEAQTRTLFASSAAASGIGGAFVGRGGATAPPVHASDQFAPARPLSKEVPPASLPSPRPLPNAPTGGKAYFVCEAADTGLKPRLLLLIGAGGGADESTLSADKGAPRPAPKASVAVVFAVEGGLFVADESPNASPKSLPKSPNSPKVAVLPLPLLLLLLLSPPRRPRLLPKAFGC